MWYIISGGKLKETKIQGTCDPIEWIPREQWTAYTAQI